MELFGELTERQTNIVVLATRMARTDLYERYPLLLEAEMEDLDLPPKDAAVREELLMVYRADRHMQALEAERREAFRRAQERTR